MPDNPLTPALFEFLEDLRDHNERDWFNEHKSVYEQVVRDPVVAWIEQWIRPLARSAPMLSVVAKRSRGSLMRIHRDTRFSRDKTPYKTNVGISLRHQADGDIHAPGVYVHLAPDECFLGAGCWRPPREALAAIRASIDANPKEYQQAHRRKAFAADFKLAGERLKTSPRDYAKDHPMIDELRRIDFIAVSPLTRQDVLANDATSEIVRRIRLAKPWMQFLCGAMDIPY
ncbi:MAG: DUF2461 domain-containing protein [Planctomycetota bacterium]